MIWNIFLNFFQRYDFIHVNLHLGDVPKMKTTSLLFSNGLFCMEGLPFYVFLPLCLIASLKEFSTLQ